MKILIVSHHTLALSMKDTISMIAGASSIKDVECLCMTSEKSPEEFENEAKNILEMNDKEDFLIFADLFGASPCNSCLSVFRHKNYRLITGMNLGMILEVICLKDNLSLEELYERAQEVGKEGIRGIYIHA